MGLESACCLGFDRPLARCFLEFCDLGIVLWNASRAGEVGSVKCVAGFAEGDTLAGHIYHRQYRVGNLQSDEYLTDSFCPVEDVFVGPHGLYKDGFVQYRHSGRGSLSSFRTVMHAAGRGCAEKAF